MSTDYSARLEEARAIITSLTLALESWVEIADQEDQRPSDQDAIDRGLAFLGLDHFGKYFYAVTGRMHGDDEATCLTFSAHSREEAVELYIESMWDLSGVSGFERERNEECGYGVCIDAVLRSNTPIIEV
jgi:hypothetical protein